MIFIKQRNTPYTLKELKQKYDNEYLEVVDYHGAHNILVRCKHCNEIYKTSTGNLNRGQVHSKCTQHFNKNRHTKYTLDEVNELYSDEYKIIVEYNNAKDVICKCKICGEIYKTSMTSLQRHSVHKKCQGILDSRRTPEKCIEKLNKLKSLHNLHVDVLEYHSYNDVVCKCKHCNKIVHVTSRSIRANQVHDDCTEYNISYGEERIVEILDALGIIYEREYSFDDCKNIFVLRFDFYIPSLNTCIEYQGQQHYMPVIFPKDTKESSINNFDKIVNNDNIKREYCKSHNIKLIEISYNQYDDIYYILTEKLSQIR